MPSRGYRESTLYRLPELFDKDGGSSEGNSFFRASNILSDMCRPSPAAVGFRVFGTYKSGTSRVNSEVSHSA